MLINIFYCCVLVTLASFICLCAQRQLNGQLPWSPKYSVCDYCHHRLSWWQLIPILGFTLQWGHCNWCHSRISPFFPLSELIILLIAAKTFSISWTHNLILACVLLTLLYLSTTDFFAKIIYFPALLGLLPLRFLLPPSPGLIIQLILIASFLFLLQSLSKGLGTGDIEFILVTDIVWGWEITAQIVLIGCLVTLFPALIKRDRKLPLIPGLALGFCFELFFCL